MKDDGSVRADAIDLVISQQPVRVICDDPAAVEFLRSVLDAHVVDEPAPVGFALRSPSAGATFHRVLDRSGKILARVDSTEAALCVLGGHLAGFLPPPADTVRVRGRALLRDDSTAVLACFPLLLDHPPIERRLAQDGVRLIDRLVVDIGTDDSIVMTSAPWPAFRELSVPTGHAGWPLVPARLDTVLMPELVFARPSRAQLVVFVAAATCGSATTAERLMLAERLTEKVVMHVPIDDRIALHAALRR